MYQNFARIKYRVKEEPREVVLNYDVNNSVLEYINTTYSEEFSKCNTPDKIYRLCTQNIFRNLIV